MASRAGRKRVPTEIKKLRGTLQPCRVIENELSPDLVDAIPMPPEDFGDDGKELWFLVVTQAHKLNILTKIALPQVIDYCTQWEVYCHNRRRVMADDHPGTMEYNNGVESFSAAYKAMNAARKEMRYFESDWGLTPASAAKIPAPGKEEKKDSEFDL